MTSNQQSGSELTLRPAEELVPPEDWLAFLKNVAVELTRQSKCRFSRGYQYADADFWRAIAYKTLTYGSTEEAADELNDHLYARARRGRGRKAVPKKLGGKYSRRRRLAPHGSQIDAFLRKVPAWFKDNLEDRVFRAQLELAVELGILDREFEVYVDFTDKFYYGNDRFPDNPFVIGVYNGPGTNRARKYGAVMVSSGPGWFFAGLFPVEKGVKRGPLVVEAVAKLQAWGFTVTRVFGDREFSTYDVISGLAAIGVRYTGTMKKTARVKPHVEAFLDKRGPQVVKTTLTPHQFTHYKLGPVGVHLVFKTDRGKRIRDVRKDLAAGNLTRAEALKKIHAFVSTEPPPRLKRQLVRWGIARATSFRRRWRIETGFRDGERFFPTTRARSNAAKKLAFALQMFAFNAWQVQRARRRRLRRVPRKWRAGPTLRRFCRLQVEVHLAT